MQKIIRSEHSVAFNFAKNHRTFRWLKRLHPFGPSHHQPRRLGRFAFQVHLAPSSGVEFAPGEFAAESEAMRDRSLVLETGF